MMDHWNPTSPLLEPGVPGPVMSRPAYLLLPLEAFALQHQTFRHDSLHMMHARECLIDASVSSTSLTLQASMFVCLLDEP
jgi:hypothetical protein